MSKKGQNDVCVSRTASCSQSRDLIPLSKYRKALVKYCACCYNGLKVLTLYAQLIVSGVASSNMFFTFARSLSSVAMSSGV